MNARRTSLARRVGAPPLQSPATSPWVRRLLGPLYFSGASWYRIHHWAAARLPERAMRLMLPLFATSFFLFLGGVRRALAANGAAVHEAITGERMGWLASRRHAWRTVSNHAWCMTETYEALAGRSSATEPVVEGLEHWQALDPRQGLVLVTAHIGHWEVGSRLAGTAGARCVHVVREPELDPQAQAFLSELLGRVTGQSYHVHFAQPGDPTLGARLLGALRRGEVVALQGDRPRQGGRTVDVELLGRPYELPLGPLALARCAGVPLLPVYALRAGRRRSIMIFRPPIRVSGAGERSAALEAAARRLASDLGEVLARAPDQWFCFRRVWEQSDLS
ncbi:MAG TPA: lysophospholipid acyltransferase family protein [Thermoanaerobaculia bacterium]|nr:lysophospholipid acyltransferase family protein [Thermoanaerobaculia bacterium]